MTERELVTLALGNYATLVAAQWANGTTGYDVGRTTLYTERRLHTVRGGAVHEQQNALHGTAEGLARVPRLVLLDAPHATRLRCRHPDVTAGVRNEESDREGEPYGGSADDEASSEEDVACDTAHSQYYTRGGTEAEGHLQADSLASGGNDYGAHPSTVPKSGARADGGSVQGPQPSLKLVKKSLFREKDSLVPWWQYIRTGVAHDAVHVLHPLHRLGATPTAGASDIPLLHNFGFGMNHLRSSVSSDVADMVEGLRRQLEDADLLQGLQCFVEGDSAFGGAACNVMEELWEDAGSKVPVTIFCCFQPLPDEVSSAQSDVDFADRRRDESHLNRLLATANLSRHESSVYVPVELSQWKTSFAPSFYAPSEACGGSTPGEPTWLHDDSATAQMIASFADSALYGTRDDGSPEPGKSGPAFYMRDWHAAVRPTRCLRVAAALASMPMRVHDVRFPQEDLWDFLQQHPLLQTNWSDGRGYFAPLTHAVDSGPEKESGRIIGHAVTLRGAGRLRDITYPRQEALVRYALPLRSGNYLPLVTPNSYPISSTFPRDLVLPGELLSSGALQGVDMGSHVVSTYGSAPMLQSIVVQAQKVVGRRRHLHEASYEMDSDEWKEVLEDAMNIRDDYYHPDDEEYIGDDEDVATI